MHRQDTHKYLLFQIMKVGTVYLGSPTVPTYSCGSAQARCRRISTERHFCAYKIKKKVPPHFFARATTTNFHSYQLADPDLWEQTFYEKVLRRLQVPIHVASEGCLPRGNGRTCKQRSIGSMFLIDDLRTSSRPSRSVRYNDINGTTSRKQGDYDYY